MSFLMEMADETRLSVANGKLQSLSHGGKLAYNSQSYSLSNRGKLEEYFVLDCNKLYAVGKPYFDVLAGALATQMQLAIKAAIKPSSPILVVGIGNSSFVADSLGPATVRKVLASAALPASSRAKLGLREVFAFNPDVFGKTGMSSAKTVQAIAKACKAKAVILIDTFSSEQPGKLGKSFQFATRGLEPGAGVVDQTEPIDSALLKMPVFSLGVPLVAPTIAEQTDMLFAPKSIDKMVHYCSQILSQAINLCLYPSLSKTETDQLKY